MKYIYKQGDVFMPNLTRDEAASTISVDDITNTSDELFRVGYILK